MSLRDEVAVVGLGLIYVPPGEKPGLAVGDLSILATQAALDDAGLHHTDLQNFAWASGAGDPGGMAATMGVPEVMFAANLTSGAGGGAGALALAASSIVGGFGDVCLSVISRSPPRDAPAAPRARSVPTRLKGGGAYGGPMGQQPEEAFIDAGGDRFAGRHASMIANRYLYEHGVPREHLGEVVDRAASERRRRDHDRAEYLSAPLIIGPLSAFDCTPELEGAFAAAVITTTVERARDFKQPAVLISAAVIGGTPSHAPSFQMPASSFGSSGHRDLAPELFAMAGLGTRRHRRRAALRRLLADGADAARGLWVLRTGRGRARFVAGGNTRSAPSSR